MARYSILLKHFNQIIKFIYLILLSISCMCLGAFKAQMFTVYVLCRYSPELQALLAENVYLTGGNLLYPGVKERVERELLAMRPFQSHFKVTEMQSCMHCASQQSIVFALPINISEWGNLYVNGQVVLKCQCDVTKVFQKH